MTRVDYLLRIYTVVVPYVVFTSRSGSMFSWLPGVTLFPFVFYKRFVSSSRLRAWLVGWRHDCFTDSVALNMMWGCHTVVIRANADPCPNLVSLHEESVRVPYLALYRTGFDCSAFCWGSSRAKPSGPQFRAPRESRVPSISVFRFSRHTFLTCFIVSHSATLFSNTLFNSPFASLPIFPFMLHPYR